MTPTALQTILNSITIIVDTRENANSHITGYFTQNGIKFIERALKFGDYSCEVDGISYENKVVLERKADIVELSGNLAQNRVRFENELTKAKEAGAKLVLMVENGSFERIIEHKYNTDLSEKSFLATLFTYSHRYNLDINFIEKRYSGLFIYYQLYYWVRNYLKEASHDYNQLHAIV